MELAERKNEKEHVLGILQNRNRRIMRSWKRWLVAIRGGQQQAGRLVMEECPVQQGAGIEESVTGCNSS
jgi:hypothetical protein